MTIKNFIQKWHNHTIQDDGPTTSGEYMLFQTEFKKMLRQELKDEFSIVSFNPNHYEFCAVLQSKKTKKYFYMSIADVRYQPNGWYDDILYRTMAHDKDWTGGRNQYSCLPDLKTNLILLDGRDID